MKNSCKTLGDFGASTRPIAFAPKIKSNKERLLKSFREKLGRKGYSPAEASLMAQNVRSQANVLAMEMNSKEKNDDPVRMGNIHTLALKMKIKDALRAAPNKARAPQTRISSTSPVGVFAGVPPLPPSLTTSEAQRGKVYSTVDVRKRGDMRRRGKEAQIYEMQKYRKARGKLKNAVLTDAQRASYMQQFNGVMGHYYGGTMGWKAFKKLASKAKSVVKKVAAPIKQAAQFTAKSVSRAAEIVKKDPIGALAKVTVAAPFTLVASIAPKNTVVGKLARKAEAGTVKVTKKTVEAIKKGLQWLGDVIKSLFNKIKDFVMKLLSKIKDFFKKAWDSVKKNIIDKVAARFTGKGAAGFGSLPQDEQNKISELTGKFVQKKALEAVGVETAIFGTAATATTATATAAAQTAATAAATAAAVTGPGAVAAATAAGTTAGTTAGTAAGATATATATKATVAYCAKVTGEGAQEISTEFAKYKASKAIPNPVIRSVVNAGIDGKIPTNPEAVKQMAAQLPAQAQQKFVEAVAKAPEAMKQEIIKKALVPQDFKKSVDFLPKEAHALAAGKPAIPQVAIANAMAKDLSKDKKIITPKPEEVKAIAAQGVAVQDQAAVKAVQEGKMNMTEAIVASSKIGKEAAIAQLPPEARPAAVAAVKKEMSHVEVARIDDKVKEEKAKTNTALLTAAAIAAKVLLF